VNPVRHIVLAVYALAVGSIFVWVPWHGRKQELVAARALLPDPVSVGYGLVWSQPKQPAAFIEYVAEDANYRDYESAHLLGKEKNCISPPPSEPQRKVDPLNWRSGLVDPLNVTSGLVCGAPVPIKPKLPEGYLPSYAYESATIDYGRVGLEFGELTVILLVVWKFTAPRINTKRDAQRPTRVAE